MRVLMVGTSLDAPGGVAAVLRTWRDAGLFERAGVRYVATNDGRGLLGKVAAALRAWCLCAWQMLTGRAELVHVHTSSYSSFWRKSPVFACALLTGRPLVVSLHGGGFREFYAARGPLGRAWIRLVMRRAQRFVVLTEAWRRWVLQVEPQARVCVIPNTVAPVVHAARTGTDEHPFILFLGRLEAAKGLPELIEALALARAGGAGWRLVCGGSGDLDAVRETVRRQGLPPEAVVLHGWVDGDAKASLLQRCAALALPSHVENMPVAILEAYAHAKPVIASAVGGVPDMLSPGREGVLVPPGDARALADALLQAWREPQAWREHGRRAHERFVREFARDAVLARVQALYDECAGGAGLQRCAP